MCFLVKNGRGQSGIGRPGGENFMEIFKRTRPAGRNHWNGNGRGDFRGEFAIEAAARAVLGDGRNENFSGSARNRFGGPRGGISAGRLSSSMRESLPGVSFALHVE